MCAVSPHCTWEYLFSCTVRTYNTHREELYLHTSWNVLSVRARSTCLMSTQRALFTWLYLFWLSFQLSFMHKFFSTNITNRNTYVGFRMVQGSMTFVTLEVTLSIWNYFPSDTELIFLHSLHLSVQLNVSISVNSSTSYNCIVYWYRVSVFRIFYFVFIF